MVTGFSFKRWVGSDELELVECIQCAGINRAEAIVWNRNGGEVVVLVANIIETRSNGGEGQTTQGEHVHFL